MWDISVLSGARTPFTVWSGGRRPDGVAGGALREIDVFELGAVALRAAIDRAGLAPGAIDTVAFSNVYPTNPQAVYGARHVSLRAGVPDSVPALTPNMACGSGLYCLLAAARELAQGAQIVAAGGTDNISQIRKGFLFGSFRDWASGGAEIGAAIDDLAAEKKIGREEQDLWSLRSHRQAALAHREGKLAEELAPAGSIRQDDAFRSDPKPADFAAAKPAFSAAGTATRLNSHALVDGASAVILASAAAARKAARPPLGRLLGAAYAGVAAKRMGYASVPAIRKLLAEAGLGVKDVDLFDINETFAAQVIIDLQELGLPEDRVNVNGGALALGHPFAGTGCRQVLSLLLELRRRKGRRGVASICVGGGQGIAVLVEALPA